MSSTVTASSPPVPVSKRWWLPAGLLIGLAVLLLVIGLSITFGAADISFATIWDALFHFEANSTQHVIIRTLRVPRALIAALVGGALAVSGAVVQGITRNPLADPGLLGIEAGAALAVVIGVNFLGINSLALYAWFAFAGAAVSAAVVYGIGSAGGKSPSPFTLTIAGAAVTALLASFTTSILLSNLGTLDEVRFWLAGSVAGRDLDLLLQALPYLLVGLVGGLLLSGQITILSLGEDVAAGLGQNTALIKGLCAVVVVLLSGASVSIAGPIGFVGLVIPHAIRFFVGVDYRWILPYAIIVGGIFLVLADLFGRLIVQPAELPIGAATALIGGPFFIWLVRWQVKK